MIRRSRTSIATLFSLVAAPAVLPAAERLLLLVGEDRIAYYRLDGSAAAAHVRTFGRGELPGMFPARALGVGGGNVVTTFDGRGEPVGRAVFDGLADRLVPYAGAAGDPAAASGRLLIRPSLDEPFRGDGSLYAAGKDARLRLDLEAAAGRAGGGRYVDMVALGGKLCGVRAGGVECRARGSEGTGAAAEPWLELGGARLVAAAVSPWQELFLADAAGACVRRFQARDGRLVPSGELTDKGGAAPLALGFSADGELFVAGGRGASSEVVRYTFVLDDFVTWRATVRERIQVAGGPLVDLALLRPAGYVVSAQTHPPVKLPRQAAGGHFGISQSVPVSPESISESAVLAIVEYEPGGHTPVHLHGNMEQMEIVVSGRALWEVGEMEREVGPGDIVFCPRNSKHGYKVLGDQPFRFYQIEWREWRRDP